MTTHPTIATHTSFASPLARHAPHVARVLLGLAFFASGIFGLLIAVGVVPIPPTPPDGGGAFFVALAKTGYMFPLIKCTETAVGVALLSNRLVALALVVIAPVLVNILAFHLFLSASGMGPGLVLAVLTAYLAWTQRQVFRPLLTPRPAELQ